MAPSPLLPLICIRAYGLIRSSIDLVPDAAGGPRRLALQLAGRRARDARQARGLAQGGYTPPPRPRPPATGSGLAPEGRIVVPRVG